MVLTSDLTVDASKFDPASITSEQHATNKDLEKLTVSLPRWDKVGASKYRELREAGKAGLPPRTVFEQGIDMTIPSRDSGREIPCRLFLPSNGTKPKGVFMHIHGGGWVLQSQLDFDPFLQKIADGAGPEASLAVISIGYRLAPENPFPAAQNDCADVAGWLIEHAHSDSRFNGAALTYIGGESAGGHLTIVTALHLLSLSNPYKGLKGLVVHFGVFTLNALPSSVLPAPELLLTKSIMDAYLNAVTPEASKNDPEYYFRPEISPLYADFRKFRGSLPPALFTCGTADILLDDTLLLGTKWLANGVKNTFVKIYPGQPHGFVFMQSSAAEECLGAVYEFVRMTS